MADPINRFGPSTQFTRPTIDALATLRQVRNQGTVVNSEKPVTVSVTSAPLASTATPFKQIKNLPRGSLVDVVV